MVRPQKIDSSLQERIDGYPSRPGSQNDPSHSADTAGELVAELDKLLLKKATEELRASELVAELDKLLLQKAAEEHPAGEVLAALDNLSQKKAAKELRVAQTRLNKFKQELGKD
jgi:hypothetical protein